MPRPAVNALERFPWELQQGAADREAEQAEQQEKD
jgi:hypothetical protein